MSVLKKELIEARARTNPDFDVTYNSDSRLVLRLSGEFDAGYPQTVERTELIWEVLDRRVALHCAKIGNYPTAQFLLS